MQKYVCVCVCVRVCVCKRGQTEGASCAGVRMPQGRDGRVTQLSRNLSRMVTSPPGWVWDEGGGFQAAAVTSLEGHAIARV